MKIRVRIPAPDSVGQVFVVKEGDSSNGRARRGGSRPANRAAAGIAIAVFLLCAVSGAAFADPSVTLAVGYPSPVGTLTFDLAADPGTEPTVAASPSSFTVQVVTTGTATWTLEVDATQAYLDPATHLIPVANIGWSATGAGFTGGTLSVNPQAVASGSGDGTFTGTLSFSMLNLWTYPTGSYSDTITYTATAI